ncbi:MAG: hypothetical protein ACYDCL_02330 [Myxococcales bacterium]
MAPRWRLPILLFASSFLIFAVFSGGRFFHQSQAPQFVYQAEAFLHGQTALPVPPPNLNDWARVGSNWYVSFPPFPAVVMMPFVWLFGYQFDDVSFTVFFAALGVALFFLLLQKLSAAGESERTEKENAALALLFAFGTVDFYCSIRGEVWFTAEVIGVTCTCLYLLAAHRAEHPALAGLALGCAAITRTPLAFSVVYFAMELFAPSGALELADLRRRRAEILEKGLQFAGPVLAIAIPMMWMNHVRFGSPLEFGHAHLFNNRVNGDIARWGLFNAHYLPRNVRAAFLLLPGLSWPAGGTPRLTFDPHGMSLFVTTPLFLFLLWPRLRPRLHRLVWLTVGAVSLPGFFYQNDGWRQFGFRFSLDYTPYLFLLLALGGRRFGRTFWALAAAGLAVNLWGALAF